MEEHAEIKASPQEPVEGIIVEPEIVDAAPSPEADQAEAETTEEEAPQDPRDVEIANLHGQLSEQLELVNSIKRQHGEAIAEFNSARTRLKREVKREVQNSLKSLIGELLETVDNLDRAIELYEKVRLLAPGDESAFENLRRLLTRAERWEDVELLLLDARTEVEGDERANSCDYMLGQLYQTRLLRPEDALDRYEAILEREPSFASAISALDEMMESEHGFRDS